LDATSQNLDAAALWVSGTDPHFTADPGASYIGTPMGLTIDVDGAPRSLTAPYKGADEPVFASLTVASAQGSPVLL